MKPRTPNYAYTVNANDPEGMKRIEHLRNECKITNKLLKQASSKYRLRITLKARLGKNNPAYQKYKGKYHYHIKIEDAQRIDVYVHSYIP